MYISLKWLKDFVKIPNKIKASELAEALTSHTVEVERIMVQSKQFNKVVLGRVLEIKKHPNADRLQITEVDVKDQKLKIVCGAPNLEVGQVVPVALIGAKLPNGLDIKESIIRGEKSSGMICAEDELGLGKNHEGILVLNNKAKIGQAFSEYLKVNDTIFEIDNKSLSNRADLLNHYGLAREIAAIFSWPLKRYDQFFNNDWNFLEDKKDDLEIKIEAKDLCLRYLALKIENIKIEESPDWLKARLIAVGQKPINNIVDLSNYVMLDCGQPLHTFDGGQIKKICVRRALNQESIKTLDDQERILSKNDLVISDGQRVLALAGIIGGKDSQIGKQSTSLILESANFLASGIRKTSQRLGLRTEASLRFEKSLDSKLPEYALKRFLFLLKDICPEMKITKSYLDHNYVPEKNLIINFSLSWLNKKIGQEIPKKFVIDSLSKLGFIIEENQNKENKSKEEKLNNGIPDDFLRVRVPSWRATKDVKTKEDLAEEVLRLYGYDQIISQLPKYQINPPELNKERLLSRKIKNILVWGQALDEVYNYSFQGEKQLEKLKIDSSEYLKLINPLSEIKNLLRQSLIPGLIDNIKNNQFKASELGFMEIGSVFFKSPGNLSRDLKGKEKLPYQEKHLGIILATSGKKDLFAVLKGIINNLLQNLINYQVRSEFFVLQSNPSWADTNSTAGIKIFDKEIGLVSVLDEEIRKNLNIKKSVVAAEIDLKILTELILSLPAKKFQEPAKYPAVMRDISFVVNSKILYNDLRQEIINFNPLIIEVELFDVFKGKELEKEQRSLAFHLTYQSLEKTLKANDVDKIHQALIKHLGQKFSAKLRIF